MLLIIATRKKMNAINNISSNVRLKVKYTIFKILEESFIIAENIKLVIDERFKLIETFTVLLTLEC